MRLVDARDLGDRDSKFADIEGVSVHYKVHAPSAFPRAAVHCYHGFGANTGSWAPVQAKMSHELDALVTSHDMPGFGLTGRLALHYYPTILQFFCRTLTPSSCPSGSNGLQYIASDDSWKAV